MAKIRIKTETPYRSGNKFDLSNCLSFSVENQGTTNAVIGYPGEGALIDIPPASVRDFTVPWGHTFEGEMEVIFDSSNSGTGRLLVIKQIAVNSEFI